MGVSVFLCVDCDAEDGGVELGSSEVLLTEEQTEELRRLRSGVLQGRVEEALSVVRQMLLGRHLYVRGDLVIRKEE